MKRMLALSAVLVLILAGMLRRGVQFDYRNHPASTGWRELDDGEGITWA